MKNERRNFLENSAKLTGLTLASPFISSSISKAPLRADKAYIRDLGMEHCLAYFWGIEPLKTALSRQLDVLGAVGPIQSRLAGFPEEKDNSKIVILAIKNKWKKEGHSFCSFQRCKREQK